jgi:hypothetical protein
VPHLLRHGTSVFKVISERPVILNSECCALGEGAITTYFKCLRFDAVGSSGARTHDLPFEARALPLGYGNDVSCINLLFIKLNIFCELLDTSFTNRYSVRSTVNQLLVDNTNNYIQ